MTTEYKDRVADTTATTGTGPLLLQHSAPNGYRAFADAGYTNGATVRYCIATQDQSQWEVTEGVWNATTGTLTRAAVPFASSNAGALVDFPAGTKDVSAVMTAKDIAAASQGAHSQWLIPDTWNPAQLGPGISLDSTWRSAVRNASGNDSPDYFNQFSSVHARSTGRCFVEASMNIDSGGWAGSFGLVDASYDTSTVTTDFPAGVIFFVTPRSNVNPSIARDGVGSNVPGLANLPAGVWVGMLIDFDLGKVWVHIAGWWVTSTNAIVAPPIDLATADPTYTFTPNRPLKLWGQSPFANTHVTMSGGPSPSVPMPVPVTSIETW